MNRRMINGTIPNRLKSLSNVEDVAAELKKAMAAMLSKTEQQFKTPIIGERKAGIKLNMNFVNVKVPGKY